ncbi:cytochrome P450 protein [Rutstroemia sp. NJR-2017a BBW]|nr:cytochrome P450 protein [Rutstroemia sp. NJR-2017a BBW]
MDSLTILPMLVCCGILYALSVVIYRLFFHPLAKFPGRKFAAATKWYEFYYDILKGPGGQFAWEIDRPIVRVNPDEIHIKDPGFYKVLYAGNPTHRDKYPPAAGMSGTSLGTFGTIEHTVHRKRRAANSYFFSQKAIAEAEGLLQERVQELCDVLYKSYVREEAIELKLKFLAFTTDTVCQLQKDTEKAEQWQRTIEAVGRITPLIKQSPWLISAAAKVPFPIIERLLPDLGRLLGYQNFKYENVNLQVLQHVKEQAYAYINSAQDTKSRDSKSQYTLFDAIRDSSLPPNEKSIDRLAHEAFVVIVAGGETTARSLAFAMYHIHANPRVLERLLEELTTAIPNATTPPSMKSLEKLPYLSAVIKETLRISAMVTSRLPLVCPEDLVYNEWTPTSMTINSVLRDPSIFSSPADFQPERWIQHDNQPHELDAYFVAFGKGTRMCQGMNFAWAELYLAIAILVRRFKFELFDTHRERDIEIARDYFLGEAAPESPGVRMVITGERP